jgi:hypothetical protein
MCLASVQYLQICKFQNHSLQDVIKLLLMNIWNCFRSTSKQVVEVMLSPVHATRHMCGAARTGTAALRVYLVSRRTVKFQSRSECTGKEKHLLSVPGIWAKLAIVHLVSWSLYQHSDPLTLVGPIMVWIIDIKRGYTYSVMDWRYNTYTCVGLISLFSHSY